jgi:hypothetical protein
MIKIQDVVVPTKGTAKYFNLLALNFSPNPSSVTFYWSILSEVENTDEAGVVTYSSGATLLDGNLTMDQATYANWGTSDDYVVDWALAQLNFTKVTE